MTGEGADPRLVILAIVSVIIACAVIIRAIKQDKK